MDAISYTAARANLTNTMQKVCNDHAPVIITRKNQPPVVMISLAEYLSIQETPYLLQTPRNTQRLTCAILELEQLIPPPF